MKVKIEKPNTVMFDVRFEEGDEYRNRCTYHTITFDLDRWVMNARTDNGNYSYGWQVEKGDRTFLELMKGINDEYLLNKVSDCNVFNIKESKEKLCKVISEWFSEELDCGEIEDIINEIKAIDDSCDLNLFIEKTRSLDISCDEHMRLKDDTIFYSLVYEYPKGAVVFAEIFTNVIQPLIKEYIENTKKE